VDQLVEQIVEIVRDLKAASTDTVSGVGICVPGIVDRTRGVAVVAANLPWNETPLAEIVSTRTQLKTLVANDADAAALAEGRFGTAIGLSTYACVTLGTGVGCGVVLHGRLLAGHARSGVELGHFIVHPNGRPCRCGCRGCLEATVAGPGLAASYLELSKQPLATPDLIVAAKSGDPIALAVLEEASQDLALAVHNLWRLIPLERLILAGGVANAGELLLAPLTRHLAHIGGRRPVDGHRIVVSNLLGRTSALSAAAAALALEG
jgi:glucokinase